MRVLLVLLNNGPACDVNGFPRVLSSAGAVPVERIDLPGPPARVVLPPGGSAFAGAEWTTIQACPAVRGFQLGLPGQSGRIPVTIVDPIGVALLLHACTTGFELGPLEATSEGTLGFPDSVAGGLAWCNTATFDASMRVSPPARRAAPLTAKLVLINESDDSCAIEGFPALQLLTAGGRSVPTQVVPSPGSAPSEVVVGPFQEVSSTVSFRSKLAGHRCAPVAADTMVTPPGDTIPIEVAGPGYGVCGGGMLVVGALEPGSAGPS